MKNTRRISPLTLALAEAMANDPNSTPALRTFHARKLADLQRKAEEQRERPASPFSRFVESLETELEPLENTKP